MSQHPHDFEDWSRPSEVFGGITPYWYTGVLEEPRSFVGETTDVEPVPDIETRVVEQEEPIEVRAAALQATSVLGRRTTEHTVTEEEVPAAVTDEVVAPEAQPALLEANEGAADLEPEFEIEPVVGEDDTEDTTPEPHYQTDLEVSGTSNTSGEDMAKNEPPKHRDGTPKWKRRVVAARERIAAGRRRVNPFEGRNIQPLRIIRQIGSTALSKSWDAWDEADPVNKAAGGVVVVVGALALAAYLHGPFVQADDEGFKNPFIVRKVTPETNTVKEVVEAYGRQHNKHWPASTVHYIIRENKPMEDTGFGFSTPVMDPNEELPEGTKLQFFRFELDQPGVRYLPLHKKP